MRLRLRPVAGWPSEVLWRPKPVAYLGQRRFAPTYTPRAFCQRAVGREALTEKMPVETRGPVCCRLRPPSWLATPLILSAACRFASAGRHNRPGIRAPGLLRASCPWPSRAHPHHQSRLGARPLPCRAFQAADHGSIGHQVRAGPRFVLI
jgi:hypothetical protein